MLSRDARLVDYANQVLGDHAMRRPQRVDAQVYLRGSPRPINALAVHGPYPTTTRALCAAKRLGYEPPDYGLFYVTDPKGGTPHPQFLKELDRWQKELEDLEKTYRGYYFSLSEQRRTENTHLEQIARYRAQSFQYLVHEGKMDTVFPVIYWDSPHVVGIKNEQPYLIVRLRWGPVLFGKLPDPEKALIVDERPSLTKTLNHSETPC